MCPSEAKECPTSATRAQVKQKRVQVEQKAREVCILVSFGGSFGAIWGPSSGDFRPLGVICSTSGLIFSENWGKVGPEMVRESRFEREKPSFVKNSVSLGTVIKNQGSDLFTSIGFWNAFGAIFGHIFYKIPHAPRIPPTLSFF